MGDGLKCSYFLGIFYHFVRVPLFSETGLNLVSWNFITWRYCWKVQNYWNFQSDKRNLDMMVVIKKVCGHVKLLVLLLPLIIFVRGKTDHHY